MKNTKLNFLALDYSEVRPLNQYLIVLVILKLKWELNSENIFIFIFGRVFKSGLSLGRIF
jgi:hypothetical protein